LLSAKTDVLGQTGTATLSLIYDSLAPAVTIGSPGGLVGSSSQTITGTGEAGTQIALFDGATALGAPVQVASNGTWSIAVSFAGSGNHVVTAHDTDLAGNVGQSAPVTFTVATKPPVFTGLTRNSNGSATLTGTADANTRVTVFDGGIELGTVTVSARGRWNFITGSGLANTTHVFTARETDASGNVSSTSGSAQLGSSGKDTLTSTSGPDIMTGGKGADLFSFVANFGADIITDFAVSGSAHDIISLKGNAVLNSYKAVMAHATQVGSSVVIRQDANDSLTLSNIDKSSLTASDFIFG
jgi:hypothetical protein